MGRDDLIGQTLGKTEIRDYLGQGGMADVYLGYQAHLKRRVAVKVMDRRLAHDPVFRQRFGREAQAMAALTHPHIVQVHDFEARDDMHYIVMQYLSGGTLRDRLAALQAKGQHYPLRKAIELVLAIGSALAYAHKRQMVHRDIKPSNILLNEEGEPILTDFGIAKMLTGTTYTQTGDMVGTPAYMSPEQGAGQSGDERSDIYSLGVLFFYLVTGHQPYEADTPLALIMKHVHQPLPDIKLLNPNLPEGITAVIHKMLVKNPKWRYQKADEVVAALRPLLTSEEVIKADGIPPLILPAMKTDQIDFEVLKARVPTSLETILSPDGLGVETVLADSVADSAADSPADRLTNGLAMAGGGGQGAAVTDVSSRGWGGIFFLMVGMLLGLGLMGWYRGGEGGDGTSLAGTLTAVAVLAELPRVTPTDGATATATATVTPTATATRTPAPTETPTVTVAPTASGTPVSVAGDSRVVPVGEGLRSQQRYVPGGTFRMGITEQEMYGALALCLEQWSACVADYFDDEQPMHTVVLDSFWIDEQEVSNELFAYFLNEKGNREESGVAWLAIGEQAALIEEVDTAYRPLAGFEQHPVVEVSWFGAVAFCEWRGGRLPTEAEWEYAARGPERLTYPWGYTFDGSRLNYCDSNCENERYPMWPDRAVDDGFARTAPVGSYPEGASWVGALDMAGNVYEWVFDWYAEDYYERSTGDNPTGPLLSTANKKVGRGGSWAMLPMGVRATDRATFFYDVTDDGVGFRCVYDE
ncbi:MAG TPA: bifunctional serine/threonine-protein kinase/formylglycine-generating enzyme family protein [Anaerolineae bacterium]|nr:bifunctional serine/threonine-protein kinase/formylglycine-generating enzyme family protein [Anaerolineae bacterium]